MIAKYWIELQFGGDIRDEEILGLVAESYRIVKHRYQRKTNVVKH